MTFLDFSFSKPNFVKYKQNISAFLIHVYVKGTLHEKFTKQSNDLSILLDTTVDQQDSQQTFQFFLEILSLRH